MKILYPLNAKEYITQKFGARPDYYKQFTVGGVPLKGHEGLDLRAPNGTEVLATDDGYIQEAIDQYTKGYGRYIKISHSWGESVYAHLQEFKVYQGLQVKKGQIIALADNTGNSTGSHLHFGIRINPYNKSDGWGGYSDPEPHFSEEVVDVITEQTKIPVGGKWGEPELQALRSILNDQDKTLVDLQNKTAQHEVEIGTLKANIELLTNKLKECQETSPGVPGQPQELNFTNPLAKLFYNLAKALG